VGRWFFCPLGCHLFVRVQVPNISNVVPTILVFRGFWGPIGYPGVDFLESPLLFMEPPPVLLFLFVGSQPAHLGSLQGIVAMFSNPWQKYRPVANTGVDKSQWPVVFPVFIC